MKILIIIVTFIILVNTSHAGGDYVEGNITKFTINDGSTVFEFKQNNAKRLLMKPCLSIKVHLKYAYVPWYSWFPYTKKTSHPSKAETRKALKYIENSHKYNIVIKFGYMGSGLRSTNEPCSYVSRGLLQDNEIILSFYNPV